MSWQNHLSGIDSSSAALIARLQLEDIIEISQLRLQDPETEGNLDDCLALELYREELQTFRAAHENTALGGREEEVEEEVLLVQDEHVRPSIFDIIVANTPPSPTVASGQGECPAPVEPHRSGYRQRITNLVGVVYQYAALNIYYTDIIRHPIRTAHRVALSRLPFYARVHAFFETPVICLEDECQAVSLISTSPSEPSSQDSEPSPSTSHNIPRHLPLRHCNACEEEAAEHDLLYENMYRTPCAHDFCGTCLIRWSRAMLLDESLFPFRCCGPIPATEILYYLEPRLAAQVVVRIQELGTSDRVYCGDPECGAFIPTANPFGVGAETEVVAGRRVDVVVRLLTCVRCGRRTCRNCSHLEHGVEECPADAETQAVLELGRTEGWQRCPGCRTLVSLDMGCNHMTCQCGAQFCYLCAAPWKSCPCPQFTEANIIPGGIADDDDEADDGDDDDALDDDGFNIFHLELLRLAEGGDPGENAVGGAAREAGERPKARPAAEADPDPDVEDLPRPPNPLAPARNNDLGWGGGGWGGRAHDPEPPDPCRRHRYRFRRTPATCETCGFLMPQFCFECRRCGQRICNRCRGRAEEAEGRVNAAPARANPWVRPPMEIERAVEAETGVGIGGPVVENQRPSDLGTPVEPAPRPAPAPEPEGAVEVEAAPAHERPTGPERLALEAVAAPEPASESAPEPVPEAEAAAFVAPENEERSPPENERRFTLIPAVLFPIARPRSDGIGFNTPAQDTVEGEDAGADAGQGTGKYADKEGSSGEDSSGEDTVQDTRRPRGHQGYQMTARSRERRRGY